MLVTSPRSPFAVRRSFDRPFDRAFDRAFAQLAAISAPGSVRSFGPSVSGSWTDDAYEFTVDLPGVPAENVAVSVTGRTVTLDVVTGGSDSSTSWTRSVRLPQTLDPEQVSARYVDGRLTVTVGRTPQPPAPEARRIELDTTPVQPALEASTEASTETPEAQSENGEGTSVNG